MRRLSSLMTLILVASVLLIGGVSAAWIYATGDPTGDDNELGISSQYPNTYTIQFINEKEVIYSIPGNAFGSTVYLSEYTSAAEDALNRQIANIVAKETSQGIYDNRYTCVNRINGT